MARKKSETSIYKEVAKEVIKGTYGNGSTRRHKLIKSGYDYGKVLEAMHKLQN